MRRREKPERYRLGGAKTDGSQRVPLAWSRIGWNRVGWSRIVLGLLLASSAGCGAGSGAPGLSSASAERPPPIRASVTAPEYASAIDSGRVLLRQATDAGVGVSVAVILDGEMVWLTGVGYADLESGRVVDPENTRFRIYSVTKPMTAVAAARLMERGALDPSAPARRYVPTYRGPAESVTPMQLATHTSGMRHYADEDEANSTRHCHRVEDALPIFQSDPLVHPPGAGETYSSWGYVLLSAVIEGATGTGYAEAMDSLVFGPAGMLRTVIDDASATVEGRATFYDEAEGTVRPADPVDNSCKWGAGAYVSTAEDVARFGAAMLNPEFLSPSSLELFMEGEDVYRAQGIGAGAAAFLVVDRSASMSVGLLSNTIGEEAGPAAQRATAGIHDLFRQRSREPD